MHVAATISSSTGPAMAGAASGVRLLLLDGFALSDSALPVDLPGTAQRILAFLALHRRRLRRMYVACTLWPDSSEQKAAGSLRSALWRLNSPGVELVHADGTHLQLSDEVQVDVAELTGTARRLSAGDEVVDAYGLAEAFSQDLLPDWYEDWVLVFRERWRHVRLLALEELAVHLSEAGAYGAAVEAGLAAVSTEPLRESAHRAVIKAHLTAGNGYEALRQYEDYARLLQKELGLEPSGLMRAVLGVLTRR